MAAALVAADVLVRYFILNVYSRGVMVSLLLLSIIFDHEFN